MVVLRMEERYDRPDPAPKGYRATFSVLDEAGVEVARAVVCANPVFAPLQSTDAAGATWRLAPNRRVMPAHWTLARPDGSVAMVYDHHPWRKLFNPFDRCGLELRDAAGQVRYRVVDPQSLPDRIMSLGPRRWPIMQGEAVVAEIDSVSRDKGDARGPLRWLRKAFTRRDATVVSHDGAPLLSGPETLCLLLLWRDLSAPDSTD